MTKNFKVTEAKRELKLVIYNKKKKKRESISCQSHINEKRNNCSKLNPQFFHVL